MRKSIILAGGLGGFLLLSGASGCAVVDWIMGTQESKTVTVQTVIDACDAFQLGLQAATVAKQGHLLSATAQAKIDALIPPVANICPPKGQMPAGPVSALITVVTNTAAIIAAAKGGQ